MGEHLDVVFPSLFDVDDNNLLKPKGKLDQDVPFESAANLSIRPILPDHFDIKPVVRVIHNVLDIHQQGNR